MPKMVVLSQTGKELNEITLADTVFGIEPNQQCCHYAESIYASGYSRYQKPYRSTRRWT